MVEGPSPNARRAVDSGTRTGRDGRGAMPAETGESGFTLVEMLVSLALTALIAVLLIQSLQATGLINRNGQRLAAQEEVQLVRGHLRRTLADAVRRNGDGGRVTFLGQGDHLTAMIEANHEAERVSRMRFDLVAAAIPGGTGLGLVETAELADAATAERPEVLLEGIAGLGLRYFGVQGQPGSAEWQPRWATQWLRKDRLPSLVEVTVVFPASDSRRWPALILPVGAGS